MGDEKRASYGNEDAMLKKTKNADPGKTESSGNLHANASKIEVERNRWDPNYQKKGPPVFSFTKSDSSIYPSYSNLTLPYRVICRQRYKNCLKEHQKQFLKEIQMHEELQPQALNGVKIYREFANPILQKVSSKDIIKLTLEQDRKLEYLLKTRGEDLI